MNSGLKPIVELLQFGNNNWNMVNLKHWLWLIIDKLASKLSSTWLADLSIIKKGYQSLSGIFSDSGVYLNYRGYHILLDPKTLVYNKVENGEIPEPAVADVIESSVTKGGNVIDVGCRYGVQTLHMHKKVGDNGNVYSFDAFPKHIQFLEKTLKRNNIGNVYTENLVVADRLGTTELWVPDNHQTGKVSINKNRESMQTISVGCVRLDEYFKEHSIEHIDLLKVDVEGAEYAVVSGLGDEIDCISTIVMEIHNEQAKNSSLSDLYKKLRQEGKLKTHTGEEISSLREFLNSRQIIWTNNMRVGSAKCRSPKDSL